MKNKKLLILALVVFLLVFLGAPEVSAYGSLTHAQTAILIWDEIEDDLANAGFNLGNPQGTPDEITRYYKFRNAFVYGANAPDASKVPNELLKDPEAKSSMQHLVDELNAKRVGGHNIDITLDGIEPWPEGLNSHSLDFAVNYLLRSALELPASDERTEKVCFALGYITHILQDKHAYDILIPLLADETAVGDPGLKEPKWGDEPLGQLESLIDFFLDVKSPGTPPIDLRGATACNPPYADLCTYRINSYGIVEYIVALKNFPPGAAWIYTIEPHYIVNFNLPKFLHDQMQAYMRDRGIPGTPPTETGLFNTYYIWTTFLDFTPAFKGELYTPLRKFLTKHLGTNTIKLVGHVPVNNAPDIEKILLVLDDGKFKIKVCLNNWWDAWAELTESEMKEAVEKFLEGYRNNAPKQYLTGIIDVDITALPDLHLMVYANFVDNKIGVEYVWSAFVADEETVDMPDAVLESLEENVASLPALLGIKLFIPEYDLDKWFTDSIEYQFLKRAGLTDPENPIYTDFWTGSPSRAQEIKTFASFSLEDLINNGVAGAMDRNKFLDDEYWALGAESLKRAAVMKSLLREGYNSGYIDQNVFSPFGLQVYDVKYFRGTERLYEIPDTSTDPINVQVELFFPWWFKYPVDFDLGLRVKADDPQSSYEFDKIVAEKHYSANYQDFYLATLIKENQGKRRVFDISFTPDISDHGYHVELTYGVGVYRGILFTTDLEPFLHNGIESASAGSLTAKREKMDKMYSTYVPHNDPNYPGGTILKSLRFSREIAYNRNKPISEPISEGTYYAVESAGWYDGAYTKFAVGTSFFSGPDYASRGIHVVAEKPSGSVDHKVFDTHGVDSAFASLYNYLSNLPVGTVVLIGVSEEATNKIPGEGEKCELELANCVGKPTWIDEFCNYDVNCQDTGTTDSCIQKCAEYACDGDRYLECEGGTKVTLGLEGLAWCDTYSHKCVCPCSAEQYWREKKVPVVSRDDLTDLLDSTELIKLGYRGSWAYIGEKISSGYQLLAEKQVRQREGVAVTCITDLVAAYNFDEGKDNIGATGLNNVLIHDESDYANDGIAKSTGSFEWRNGIVGSAINFNGDDWVEVPYSNCLDITGTITLEAWIKPDTAGDHDGVIRRGEQYGLMYKNYGYDVRIANAWLFSVYNVVNVGEWHYVALTYDKSTAKLYINGNLVGQKAISASNTLGTWNLWIGNAYGGNFFDGLIDEVRIYNRALSAQEIRDRATIMAVYNFDEGKDNIGATGLNNVLIHDESDYANDGIAKSTGSFEWRNGIVGSAMVFSDDDWVEVPDSESLKIIDAITVEAWVKNDDINDPWSRIVTKGKHFTNENYGWLLDFQDVSGGKTAVNFYIEIDGTQDSSGNSGYIIEQSKWYHVVGTFDGNYINIYINGELKNSKYHPGTITETGGPYNRLVAK